MIYIIRYLVFSLKGYTSVSDYLRHSYFSSLAKSVQAAYQVVAHFADRKQTRLMHTLEHFSKGSSKRLFLSSLISVCFHHCLCDSF
jgi:hypothetical protein